MTKITIITKGIGIVYQKDNKWKEIIPFGEFHQVNFSYKKDSEKSGTKPKPWAGADRKITVSTNNAASETKKGDQYDKFLDITGSAAHSGGVELLQKWEQKGVLMEIENAVFSVNEMTKSRYNLLDSNGNVVEELGYIGYSGKAEIEIEKDGFVKIALLENGKEIDSETFEYAAGSHTVCLDNDCYQETLRSTGDFEMIYDVIKDKKIPERRFTIDRHPDDKPPNKEINEKLSSSDAQIESTNPPPLEEGLPCHIVVISLPEDLP